MPANSAANIQLRTIGMPGEWTNVAAITGGLGLGDVESNNSGGSTVTVIDIIYDLSLATTASPNPVTVGEEVTLRVDLNLSGPSGSTGINTVQVTAPLPAGLTYVEDSASGTYEPATGVWDLGSLASFNSSLIITAVAETEGTHNFAAAITSGLNDDTNPNNNQSSVDVMVEAGPPGKASSDLR
jgi:uncharacterized repeat protein (TIGR01451 family)